MCLQYLTLDIKHQKNIKCAPLSWTKHSDQSTGTKSLWGNHAMCQN